MVATAMSQALMTSPAGKGKGDLLSRGLTLSSMSPQTDSWCPLPKGEPEHP